ncbi:MAG: asparagine synthase-related protein, partial [Blastocatellia bacterium]
RVASLESCLYMRNQLLRDADWAAMAHSVEVRVPLVDSWLLRAIVPVTAGGRWPSGKALLANSPSRPLPGYITSRRKTGFVVPIDAWLEKAGLDMWRRIPQLSRPGVHWSRRWAFTTAELELSA